MRVLPYGDRALLLDLPRLDDVLALTPAVAEIPGVLDVVPATRTILVRAAPGTDLRALAATLRRTEPRAVASGPGQTVRIEVRYDGADLAEVARRTGLSAADVIAAHTGTPWRVAFGGFAPGFGYLVGGDPRLVLPRREEPRVRVPAGSVGLAGEFSGVYPTDSPGGWQLIGRTDAVLWDLERDPPALLRPGMTVEFVAATGRPGAERAS